VKAVHVVNVEWKKDEKGNFGPQKVPGTEKVLPAQLVLLAMGFLGPEQPLLDALNVERDARSNIKAEHEKYTTSLPGSLRRRRLPPWSKSRRLGLQRRPRCRPRVRPVLDGCDEFAVIGYAPARQ
jgi:hypothetical protein